MSNEDLPRQRQAEGINPIIGAEVTVGGNALLLYVVIHGTYSNLCRLP